MRIEEENDYLHIPISNHLVAPPNWPNVASDPPSDPNPTPLALNALNPKLKSKEKILQETAPKDITSFANIYVGSEANRNRLIELKIEREKK